MDFDSHQATPTDLYGPVPPNGLTPFLQTLLIWIRPSDFSRSEKYWGAPKPIPDKASHPKFDPLCSIHRICGTRGSTPGMLQNTGKTGNELTVIWKRWFETVPWRATLATSFPALCPRILGTRFTNYGLRMFWGELMVIWKGWSETVPCRATLNTPFSALCPRILGTRFTNYGLRVSGKIAKAQPKKRKCGTCGRSVREKNDEF